MIGQQGLTPAVTHEIDVALGTHELIKVKVLGAGREAREALLQRICDEVECAAVQHLGRLLVLWRPKPAEPPAAAGKQPRRRRRQT